MALQQHKDANLRYQQQVDNSRTYVLPFIEQATPLAAGMRVMEIGCGEGGVLTPLLERGCQCVGVDLDLYALIWRMISWAAMYKPGSCA